MKKPRSSEAYEGDTVIIVCEVVGDPKPEIIWLRDFLKVSINDALLFALFNLGPFLGHKKLEWSKAINHIGICSDLSLAIFIAIVKSPRQW